MKVKSWSSGLQLWNSPEILYWYEKIWKFIDSDIKMLVASVSLNVNDFYIKE